MAMTEKKIRVTLRWLHIGLGIVVLCYIYSPFNQFYLFQVIMKFGIIPLITLSGIGIWQFKSINKMLKISQQ